MLENLVNEAAQVGLVLHFGKMKILGNRFGHSALRHVQSIQVCGRSVQVLQEHQGAAYLGRLLNLVHPHDIRIAVQYQFPLTYQNLSKI